MIRKKLAFFLFRRLPFLVLLIPYLFFVFFTYKDYGVAIDEPMEYGFGEMMYNRTFGRDSILLRDFSEEHNNREIWSHNHFHAMLLYIFNNDASFEGYHLGNMLFFILGLYVAYEIGLLVAKQSWLALIAPLMLLLLPRYVGDVPSNVKDPVFATYYLLGMVSIVFAPKIKHPVVRTAFVGLLCGPAAAMRTVGYSLLLVYGITTWIDLFLQKKMHLRFAFLTAVHLVSVFFVMLFVHAMEVPFIASDPLHHFIRLLQVAKEFPWQGTMLYMGKHVVAGQLPWHYPIVWAAVTMPIFSLVLGMIGSIFLIKNSYVRAFVIAWIINLCLYYVLQPVIYDGIRHLLYIPVLLTMVAALSVIVLLQQFHGWKRNLMIILLMLHVGVVGHQYLQLHPYEYIYFNEVVGYVPGAYGKFETDYWGTSYYEAARWLIQNHGDEHAVVGLCGNEYAKKYFDDTTYTVVWIPKCEEVESFRPDFVFAFGRDDEWKKPAGEVIYAVQREGVPLVKIIQRVQ